MLTRNKPQNISLKLGFGMFMVKSKNDEDNEYLRTSGVDTPVLTDTKTTPLGSARITRKVLEVWI